MYVRNWDLTSEVQSERGIIGLWMAWHPRKGSLFIPGRGLSHSVLTGNATRNGDSLRF